MKWNEVFTDNEARGDMGYSAIREAAALCIFYSRPLETDRELSDKEEAMLVKLLKDIKHWSGHFLERCGCGPAGKVIVSIRGGVAEVEHCPDDIIVEIQDCDNDIG